MSHLVLFMGSGGRRAQRWLEISPEGRGNECECQGSGAPTRPNCLSKGMSCKWQRRHRTDNRDHNALVLSTKSLERLKGSRLSAYAALRRSKKPCQSDRLRHKENCKP
eukprot:7211680-Pyramimonas_sp.AAC.1